MLGCKCLVNSTKKRKETIPSLYSPHLQNFNVSSTLLNQSKDWASVERGKKDLVTAQTVKQFKLNFYWLNSANETSSRHQQSRSQEHDNKDEAEVRSGTGEKELSDETPEPPPIFVQGVHNISSITNL